MTLFFPNSGTCLHANTPYATQIHVNIVHFMINAELSLFFRVGVSLLSSNSYSSLNYILSILEAGTHSVFHNFASSISRRQWENLSPFISLVLLLLRSTLSHLCLVQQVDLCFQLHLVERSMGWGFFCLLVGFFFTISMQKSAGKLSYF